MPFLDFCHPVINGKDRYLSCIGWLGSYTLMNVLDRRGKKKEGEFFLPSEIIIKIPLRYQYQLCSLSGKDAIIIASTPHANASPKVKLRSAQRR
jgi:hypothetical protein